MTPPLAIAGCGAVTSVGLSALSSCAAIRAHISAFSESKFFHQSFGGGSAAMGERIVHARVPLAGPEFERGDFSRLVRFAALAIRECVQGSAINVRHTALILGVREDHRERPDFADVDHEWIEAIESDLGARFHDQSYVIREGHTSVFQALLVARRLLREKAVSCCIVGGVDSYLNVFDMERMVGSYRVLGPTVNRGLIPGEGAAFVAVVDPLSGLAPRPTVCVMGIGMAREDNQSIVLSDGHPTGRGLESALHAAVVDADVPEARIDLRISDQNGERYRTDESLLASTRFYRTWREHLEIWHPADCFGDIGAASGPMSLILGWAGLSQGYSPGSVLMCESSSDGGARAGCLLARIGDGPGLGIEP